ncbi:hypothetical protein ILYODFUR_021936 [Ilyodon furcidens]|uniref:Uncharacterized protein n=1 Tax=Ilyodon furcidens TaxID=33524 RepID=A0ABV0V7Z4_9TELE
MMAGSRHAPMPPQMTFEVFLHTFKCKKKQGIEHTHFYTSTHTDLWLVTDFASPNLAAVIKNGYRECSPAVLDALSWLSNTLERNTLSLRHTKCKDNATYKTYIDHVLLCTDVICSIM